MKVLPSHAVARDRRCKVQLDINEGHALNVRINEYALPYIYHLQLLSTDRPFSLII